MSKKKSIYDSGTTKGSAPRTSDRKRYSDNWDRIFGGIDYTTVDNGKGTVETVDNNNKSDDENKK